MAYAVPADQSEPMGDLNTTPLIDVMLVLLVMFIITIPVATHEVAFDLRGPSVELPQPNLLKNKIIIDAADQIFWNGEPISTAQLAALLNQTRMLPVEPELQFEPLANASYKRSASALNLIENSGVTNFGFVGNYKYQTLD